MKVTYLNFLMIGMLVLCACNNEDDNALVSEWHLIEQLADPGDGSGTFQPVQSDKTVLFHADGTITSNGSLCVMSPEVGTPSAGTYDEASHTIQVDNCSGMPYPLTYEEQGEFLILNYPCIEPCREKYERVRAE